MSTKRAFEDASSDASGQQDLFISSPIEDRASTFLAHFSPSITLKQMRQSANFEGAMHRVAAWRQPSSQRSLRGEIMYDTGHDDDGEKYAGKRLERVLIDEKIEGILVCARWYGGVMLGPVRFDHIENCAKEAITNYRAHMNPGSQSKKLKVAQDDPKQKLRLIAVLAKRDASIAALRGHELLADPNSSTVTGSGVLSPKSPSKKPDYKAMTQQQLLRLEKARDATIAWLLQQINEAETKLIVDGTKTLEAELEGTDAIRRSSTEDEESKIGASKQDTAEEYG